VVVARSAAAKYGQRLVDVLRLSVACPHVPVRVHFLNEAVCVIEVIRGGCSAARCDGLLLDTAAKRIVLEFERESAPTARKRDARQYGGNYQEFGGWHSLSALPFYLSARHDRRIPLL
jgi:hypothetical protein